MTRPNDAWMPGFVADQLINGHRFRALTVADVCSGCSVIMAANFIVSWSICGPITTRCRSISHDPVSRRTMRMWNPSMPRCDGSASMHTGSSPCPRRKPASRPGGGSITRVALIGRCRIERQQNSPSGTRRIRSTNLHYRRTLSLDLVQKSLADQSDDSHRCHWPTKGGLAPLFLLNY